MATVDKTVGDLPEATELNDDSLLVMEQNGEARKIKGKVIKDWVEPYSTAAVNANAAAQSALAGVKQAINNIPAGSTPIVNDLTTGGKTSALSAEMGKVLGQRPNPNLLDNWYFLDPINQRGADYYGGATGYTIDRWKMTNANTCLYASANDIAGNNGILLMALNDTATPYLQQLIEKHSNLLGKTITLSALDGSGVLYTATSTLPSALTSSNTLYCNVATVFDLLMTATALSVRLKASAGDGRSFIAVKLELGSVQTLAHQDSTGAWVLNDPPPNKALELAKCQRYQVVYASSGALTVAASAATRGTTYPNFALVLPTCLRATPSVSFSDLAVRNTHDGTTQEVTAVTVGAVSNNIVVLGAAVATATGADTDYSLRVLSGGKLILDANL